MKRNKVLMLLAILLLASLACSLFGSGRGGSEEILPSGGDSGPGEVSPLGSEEEENTLDNYDTDFPLPDDVDNLMDFDNGTINYQTTMSLNDVVEFYRDAFASADYDERDITTVINDTNFSIVWDGHPSGKAIVVQGVDLGDGTVNVNVRFDDV